MSRLPEAGARVGVKVHEWNALLVSTVAEAGAEALVIALPSGEGGEYDLPKGIAVDLEWVSPRGLMRVRGKSGGQRDAGGAAAVVVELTGAPEVFQRRDYVRANAMVDLLARRPGFSQSVGGTTIDLSGGGLQASIPGLAADVDDRLELELALPDEAPVTVEARVTRKPTRDTFSLAFDSIEPKEQERLIRFVFQKLRGAGKAAA